MESFDGLTLDEFLKAREYAIRTRQQNPLADAPPAPEGEEPTVDLLSEDY